MHLNNLANGLDGVPSFDRFTMRDKNVLGRTEKFRIIYSPNPAMRELHRRLLYYLRRLPVDMPYATGAVVGSSPVRNVRLHTREAHVHYYSTDLEHAYSSVSGVKLARVLCQVDPHLKGQESAVLDFLSKYCLVPLESDPSIKKGASLDLFDSRDPIGLITGGNASPHLFNMYCLGMDEKLGTLCEKNGITYSRYLDDLLFSSHHYIDDNTRREIRKIVVDEGFGVNHQKSALADLTKGPCEINGVGIRLVNSVIRGPIVVEFLPRHFLRRLRGLIHAAMNPENNISPQVVHGMMGVFKDTTRNRYPHHLNKTERKLVRDYGEFRELSSTHPE